LVSLGWPGNAGSVGHSKKNEGDGNAVKTHIDPVHPGRPSEASRRIPGNPPHRKCTGNPIKAVPVM
jgi:hypothetical protein